MVSYVFFIGCKGRIINAKMVFFTAIIRSTDYIIQRPGGFRLKNAHFHHNKTADKRSITT